MRVEIPANIFTDENRLLLDRIRRGVMAASKEQAEYIRHSKLNKPAKPYTPNDVGTQVLVRRSWNLVNSIDTDVTQTESSIIGEVNASDDLIYGKFHEFGTSRLRVRSFMNQPLAIRQNAIIATFSRVMNAV